MESAPGAAETPTSDCPSWQTLQEIINRKSNHTERARKAATHCCCAAHHAAASRVDLTPAQEGKRGYWLSVNHESRHRLDKATLHTEPVRRPRNPEWCLQGDFLIRAKLTISAAGSVPNPRVSGSTSRVGRIRPKLIRTIATGPSNPGESQTRILRWRGRKNLPFFLPWRSEDVALRNGKTGVVKVGRPRDTAPAGRSHPCPPVDWWNLPFAHFWVLCAGGGRGRCTGKRAVRVWAQAIRSFRAVNPCAIG